MSKIEKLELTIGADPELAILDSYHGRYVNAHGLIPGTKDEPFKVEKGAVQVDGTMVEFNIDPAKTAQEFDFNITVVLKQLREMINKVNKNYTLSASPYVTFGNQQFKEFPRESKILGCDPDFNALTGKVSVKSVDLTDRPLRTAAGHIHIGWTKDEDAMSNPHFEDCRFLAEHFWNLDKGLCQGFSSLGAGEIERLKYYGGDGAFRPKPYGVELRSYSNIWVLHPQHRRRMFDYITKEVNQLYKG